MTANPEQPALTAATMAASFDFDLVLAPAVVLVVDGSLVPARSATKSQRKAQHPFRQIGSLGSGVDIVQAAGPGAPVAAITVEFLAHFGVERLVLVGSAGRLHEPTDNMLSAHAVVREAVSDEGTSAHYGGDLSADAQLTAALAERSSPTCVSLTTDVPFRHTPERLGHHRDRADITEMECAALFAASHHVGVRAAALVAISDIFTADGWKPVPRKIASDALAQAVTIATQVLTESS